MSNTQASKRVGMISLGCPKALVDSERILTKLQLDGYDISPDYADADVVVVNTCGFIDGAKQESLDSIKEAMRENGRVIVTGCMGAVEEDIRRHHPDVLAVSGPHEYDSVVNSVHQFAPIAAGAHNPFTDLMPPQGIKLTPKHYAYLKISEGCNHRCSFCIIPSMRGDLVSRPIDEVLREAETLVQGGTRELLVISQDTSAYGVDTGYAPGRWRDQEYETRFYDLCEGLGELGVWVRLHYVYPYPHVDHVMPLMADGAVLPYLDIPFQHANQRLLKLMKRPAHNEKTLRRIESWRAQVPDLALRSTFIVGFPGETEAEFEELLQWLQAAQLDRVGCFEYSPVEGAGANALPDHIPEAVKAERKARFMAVQEEISRQRMQAKVGAEMEILIDYADADGAIGRSWADAPEIDGQVHLPGVQGLQPGDALVAEIIDADEHDLFARPVQD